MLAAITTALTIIVFARWTGSRAGALLAALIVAWHPTRAESVAWISGRTDLLVTLFILLVCQARALRTRHFRFGVAFEIVATLGAYTCKETAIALPAFVAFEQWVEAKRPPLIGRSILPLLRSSLAHLIVAASYLTFRSRLMVLIAKIDSDAIPQALATRIGLVFETLGRALHLSLWPAVSKAQHGLIAIDGHGNLQIDTAYAWFGAISFVVFALLILVTRRRRPLVTWGIALFLITWLPTSNVVLTRLACILFERFLFLPNLGLALAMLGLVAGTSQRASRRIGVAVVSMTLLSLEFSKSYTRTLDYADPVRFWTHEAQVNPLSTVAAIGLVDSTRLRSGTGEALQLLEHCYHNALKRRQLADSARCVLDAAGLLADSTLDLDQPALEALTEFYRAAADPASSRVAALDIHNASLSIDLSNATQRKAVQDLHGTSLAMLSAIESRTGDPRAIGDARAAIADCAYCPYVARAARALAAAGAIDESLTSLETLLKAGAPTDAVTTRAQIVDFWRWRQLAASSEGPTRLHAEAQAYLSIGLFGAAYRVLAPHRRDFESILDVSRDFARIAFYAGDDEAAREALLKHMTARDVDIQVDRWRAERSAAGPRSALF